MHSAVLCLIQCHRTHGPLQIMVRPRGNVTGIDVTAVRVGFPKNGPRDGTLSCSLSARPSSLDHITIPTHIATDSQGRTMSYPLGHDKLHDNPPHSIGTAKAPVDATPPGTAETHIPFR